MIPVILSGGSGTRLWPVSRQQMPKQFCHIFGKSLQTMTLERCQKMGTPWIITSKALKTLTELNLKSLKKGDAVTVVYEPVGKNTAPAIAILCHLMSLQNKNDEVVGIFPADHLIAKEEIFLNVVEFARSVAEENRVVTLGINPSYPETGYGYIQTEPESFKKADALFAFPVVKFHEKPSLERAQSFIDQGSFSWNAGIFVFKVSHMAKLFEKHQPDMWREVVHLKLDLSNLAEVYAKLPSISIDYAIMEKLSGAELTCIPAEFGWNDVGSWDAVAALESGETALSVNAKNNFVFGVDKKHYSVIGADDLILVDTVDALMVIKKGQSQDVRHVVEALNKEKSKLTTEHVFEYRPWGYFEILKDTGHFRSKVVRLNPQAQLAAPVPISCDEHWTITEGIGEVVIRDQVVAVKAGSHVHVPSGTQPSVRNTSDAVLEFVEVQLGVGGETLTPG